MNYSGEKRFRAFHDLTAWNWSRETNMNWLSRSHTEWNAYLANDQHVCFASFFFEQRVSHVQIKLVWETTQYCRRNVLNCFGRSHYRVVRSFWTKCISSYFQHHQTQRSETGLHLQMCGPSRVKLLIRSLSRSCNKIGFRDNVSYIKTSLRGSTVFKTVPLPVNCFDLGCLLCTGLPLGLRNMWLTVFLIL